MNSYEIGWRSYGHFLLHILPNFGDVGTFTIEDSDKGKVFIILTTERGL